jgi:hypothetical protein
MDGQREGGGAWQTDAGTVTCTGPSRSIARGLASAFVSDEQGVATCSGEYLSILNLSTSHPLWFGLDGSPGEQVPPGYELTVLLPDRIILDGKPREVALSVRYWTDAGGGPSAGPGRATDPGDARRGAAVRPEPQPASGRPPKADDEVLLVAKELREYCADAGRAELGVAVWPIRDTVQELCGRGDPQMVLNRVMQECDGECSYIVMRNGEIVDQGRRHAARTRSWTPNGLIQQQGPQPGPTGGRP